MRAGSRVKIVAKNAVSHGREGTVSRIDTEHYKGDSYRPIAVRMDTTKTVFWWAESELLEL